VKDSDQLRILIADDHEVVRSGIRSLLSERPGWIVCAEAATGREAVARAEEHRPDIAVMDITMPEINGLEATRKIHKSLPKTEVLILSIHYTDQLVREIVDAGARGYMLKSDTHCDLLIALEALANHQPFFTRALPKS
jgi:DNA-binding NarL/FixJ family response regulator